MPERRPSAAAARPAAGKSRKPLWIGLGVAAALVLAGGLGGALFARSLVRSKLQLIADEAHLQLELADVGVSPLGRVTLHGLAFKRKDGSSLMAVQDVDARFSLWRVLAGRRRPSQLDVRTFALDVLVADGKPTELLDLYKAVRKVFPRKPRSDDDDAKQSASSSAFSLEQGTLQVRVQGKGSAWLSQGLRVHDVAAHIDLAHGVGDAMAVCEGAVASTLKASLVPQPDGDSKLVARFEPEFRLNLSQGAPLPMGVDGVSVGGFAYDAEGAAIEDVQLRRGDVVLASVAHVRPAKSGVGVAAHDLRFSLPEKLAVAKPEPAPAKKKAPKPTPAAPVPAPTPKVPGSAPKTSKPGGPVVAPMPMPDRASPDRNAPAPAPDRQAVTTPAVLAAAPGVRAWQGSIALAQVALDGMDGVEIPITAKLEQLKLSLPGEVGTLTLPAAELHTDRMPGEQPLEALTQLKVTEPALELPWREDALAQLPGGRALWRAVTLAEQAKLRAQVEDEVLEEIVDPNLPPDLKRKQIQQRVDEKLRATGNLPAEDDKLGKTAAKGKPATADDKKQPAAARHSHVANYVPALRDLHAHALEVDGKLRKVLTAMAQMPRLKVEVVGGRLSLQKQGGDKAFGGVQDIQLAWSPVLGDGSRTLTASAKPFDDERTWGELSTDLRTLPGGALERVQFKLAGGQFAQALRVVSSNVTVAADSDITVNLQVTTGVAEGARLSVTGDFAVRKVGFDWWRLAPRPIENLSLGGKVELNVVENDGSMSLKFPGLQLGEATMDVLVEATSLRDKPTVHVRAEMPKQDCGKALHAIPPAMLSTIGEIEAKGEVSWLVDLAVPLQNVYKATLDLQLDDATCEVLKFGTIDLQQFAGDFTRPVNENGEMLDGHDTEHPNVPVGPLSESWAPLAELPPWVPWSMIATEDGSFYKHRGLRPTLLLRAIRLDLDYGRFVYGGSTITQQLVKNIFLTRAKNLARKFEELLIVWQMEHALPKDRILELYVNMIEFGPKIYGIQRAAQTYFGKDAKDLSPLETSFLAANKPCPRCGWARFSGKKWDAWWQERMIGIMTKARGEGIITEEQFLAEQGGVPKFLGWPTTQQGPAQPLGGVEE
jgi:hypothetical protein